METKKYDHIIFQDSVYPIQLIDTMQKYLNKIVDLTGKKQKVSLRYMGISQYFEKKTTFLSKVIENALRIIKPHLIHRTPVGRI